MLTVSVPRIDRSSFRLSCAEFKAIFGFLLHIVCVPL